MDGVNTDRAKLDPQIEEFLQELEKYPADQPVIHKFFGHFMYQKYGQDLVQTNDIWYRFDNHRWVPYDADTLFWPTRMKEIYLWIDQCIHISSLSSKIK